MRKENPSFAPFWGGYRLAESFACRLSRTVGRGESWEALFWNGIRRATAGERKGSLYALGVEAVAASLLWMRHKSC